MCICIYNTAGIYMNKVMHIDVKRCMNKISPKIYMFVNKIYIEELKFGYFKEADLGFLRNNYNRKNLIFLIICTLHQL